MDSYPENSVFVERIYLFDTFINLPAMSSIAEAEQLKVTVTEWIKDAKDITDALQILTSWGCSIEVMPYGGKPAYSLFAKNGSFFKTKTHGGKRPGAGRPFIGRTQHKLQATDEEWELIKKYADKVRSK